MIMPIPPTEKGQGKVHNFSVGSSADAVQQFARILRTQDLIESAGTRSIPGLQPVSGKYEDPYAPGGDLGPTFHNPMYKDPETGGWVPGIDPAKVAPTKPEPAQQPAPSPQPQLAQQQQPNSQKPAVQSGQPEASQLDPNQQQQPETVADVPAGADEHIFGLPDVTGHKEGDTWEEFLPPTPGNSKGIRRVNTIPFGNGTQTVDQVIYNANGTITHSRVVANGLGGFQRWNNESTGAGSYVDKRTAEAPARIQSFEPGSSTSGPPDRESGANRGWTETYGNSYDSDGNLVGTDRGVRNAAGLYNNVHSDLAGNRLVTLVTPNGSDGFKSRLAMQLDPSGYGVYVDPYDKEWSVFPDGHGRLGMQRTEDVGGGIHFLHANSIGVVTDEFKPKSGKAEEWYRDTEDVDGFRTRLLADFTVIKYDKSGKEISRTEHPDGKAGWEKLGLGFGSVILIGIPKTAWTLISYPFRKVVDSMASLSSVQVTDTGLMTTYQSPNRESELLDIGKSSVMPMLGPLKYGFGTLADSMVSLGSVQATPAGLATTYKPPDRTGELIHDVTGISREGWAKDPWGSAGATTAMVALMFLGPKGRAAPVRIGTSMDTKAASISAPTVSANIVKSDVIPFGISGMGHTEILQLNHGWGPSSMLGDVIAPGIPVSPNAMIANRPRFPIIDRPERATAPVAETMGNKLHSLKPPPEYGSMAKLPAPKNSPLTGRGAATPIREPQSTLMLKSIVDRSETANTAEVKITMDAQVEASVGSGRARASSSGTGVGAASGQATGHPNPELGPHGTGVGSAGGGGGRNGQAGRNESGPPGPKIEDPDGPLEFENLFPEDRPDWARTFSPQALLSGRSGKYAYVVLQDGSLVLGRITDGHVSLAKGELVLAAGELKMRSGRIVELNNLSGHYRPWGKNAENAAVRAFNENGFSAEGKYVGYEFP
ncbi:hypothetical protein ACQP06_00580 [Nocardia sp. CA-136227]|uniref:hypothetical protein n=1 Tax=Nocardia sp. CA-136227 TaxID=3239979 RepID=UPI003D989F7F